MGVYIDFDFFKVFIGYKMCKWFMDFIFFIFVLKKMENKDWKKVDI